MMNEWANIVDEIKDGNFDTYKNKRLADQNEQALISFFRRIGYKEHEIAGELDIHRIEVKEIMQ